MIRAAFLGIFFLSGFAALLYQTIWQRLLTLFGGADVYAVTIVVSAFMAGLGAGHLAGGYLADRLAGRARLLTFAACEGAVALFGLSSAGIYYDFLYGHLGSWDLPRAALAAIVFLVTLWPTFFMGMSLPLAARVLTDDASEPARWVPRLYGWNTAGAACGALFTIVVLFRSMDFRDSLRVGAAISLTCAVAALLCWRSLFAGRPVEPSRENGGGGSLAGGRDGSDPTTPPTGLTLGSWIAVYALSGFVALSLEIVWFRVLGVAVKSSAFTFGHLLAIYLGGVGLGSLVAGWRPLRRLDPAPTFFVLQAAVPAWAALSVSALVYGVGRVPWLDGLWTYFGEYEFLGLHSFRSPVFYQVYGVMPIVLLGPATLFMGLSFAFLQRAVQTDLRALGRRVGWLQTANIAGSLLGALLTGTVLLEWFGSAGTLRLLTLAGGLFVWLLLRSSPGRRSTLAAAAAAGVLLLAAVAVPPGPTLWARLHGAGDGRQVVQAEGASGLSVLRTDPHRTTVFVNGLGQSWLPFGGIHTVLGALPALVHPNPERIAIIGLGSGDTVWSAGGRAETRTIDSIEIISSQLRTLELLDARARYPALSALLSDARVRHRFTDGRVSLLKGSERYDIIEADALRPASAYSGNLYSVEYFSLLRERLRPGGLAVTWVPTPRVLASMANAFPYVASFGTFALASSSPIPFDRGMLATRIAEVSDYYRAGGIDLAALMATYTARDPVLYGPDSDRSMFTDVNSDLFPRDEFVIPLPRQAGN